MGRELHDYGEYVIEDEPIIVVEQDIHLLYDTIQDGSATIFSDEAHTEETTDFFYTLKNSYIDDEGGKFTAIKFSPAFFSAHEGETWYISYTSFGDIVKAEDINNRSYRYDVFEAGETLLSNKAVCLKEGKIYYSDNTDVTTINVLGVTRQAGYTGDMLEVYLNGEIFDSGFNFDTTKDIFVAENGGLTQVPPSTGYSGIIAKPITDKRIKIVEFFPIVL